MGKLRKWLPIQQVKRHHTETPEIDEILQKGIKEFRDGFCIGLLIATTAIRNNAILVTSDIMGAVIKEFYSRFRYENWTK